MLSEYRYVHFGPPLALSPEAGENEMALKTQTFSHHRHAAQSLAFVREGSLSLSGLVIIPAGHIS
jgi:hypothetical protein